MGDVLQTVTKHLYEVNEVYSVRIVLCLFTFNTETSVHWPPTSGLTLSRLSSRTFVLLSVSRWSRASVVVSDSLSDLGVKSTQPRSGRWQAVSISVCVGRLRAFVRVSITQACLILWKNSETEHHGCCLSYVHGMSLIGIGRWWIPVLLPLSPIDILSLMYIELSWLPFGIIFSQWGLLLLYWTHFLSASLPVSAVRPRLKEAKRPWFSR